MGRLAACAVVLASRAGGLYLDVPVDGRVLTIEYEASNTYTELWRYAEAFEAEHGLRRFYDQWAKCAPVIYARYNTTQRRFDALSRIPFHATRYRLLEEFFRVLKCDGRASLAMGFGAFHGSVAGYRDDVPVDGGADAQVAFDDPDLLVHDLDRVGFRDMAYWISTGGSGTHAKTLVVAGRKQCPLWNIRPETEQRLTGRPGRRRGALAHWDLDDEGGGEPDEWPWWA
ncbi:hypothetical protein SO694_00193015 [Aureococcus anophagefferens]|uniref:Uncharacterized protein n=1 Tax=Aureococcus anophagefferens TaxID=44056 RepID=A0ABR1FNY4_AURAN